jgi:hypothetical protein
LALIASVPITNADILATREEVRPSVNKLALAALTALALALIPLAVAHAATISASNADDLNYIIYYKNATITISAADNAITITNGDANYSALIVFNPAFALTIHGISGATIALVNASNNYAVIDTVNATDAGYGGKAVNPDLALGLIIPPNSTASISYLSYESSDASEALNAPTPPEGYTFAGDKQGTGNSVWTWSAPGKGSLWVAFYDDSYTSTLEVKEIVNRDFANIYIDIPSNPGKFVTATADIESAKTLTFSVTSTSGKQWEVIWAYKNDAAPQPQPQPTTTQDRPSANIPNDNNKTVLYAVAGLAVFMLVLVIAASLTRR